MGMVDLGDRQGGRTTRQLQRLPAGAYFVVAYDAQRRYVWKLIRHLGLPIQQRQLLTVSEAHRRILGCSPDVAFVFDHAWHGLMASQQERQKGYEVRDRERMLGR